MKRIRLSANPPRGEDLMISSLIPKLQRNSNDTGPGQTIPMQRKIPPLDQDNPSMLFWLFPPLAPRLGHQDRAGLFS